MCLVTFLALVDDAAVIATVERRRVRLVLVAIPVVTRREQFAAQLAGRCAVAVEHVVQRHVGIWVRVLARVDLLSGGREVSGLCWARGRDDNHGDDTDGDR